MATLLSNIETLTARLCAEAPCVLAQIDYVLEPVTRHISPHWSVIIDETIETIDSGFNINIGMVAGKKGRQEDCLTTNEIENTSLTAFNIQRR